MIAVLISKLPNLHHRTRLNSRVDKPCPHIFLAHAFSTLNLNVGASSSATMFNDMESNRAHISKIAHRRSRIYIMWIYFKQSTLLTLNR